MNSSIAHDRFGSPGGPPVLLVHGIGHRRQAWGRVPELLADRGYDVIAADLPGHGESPPPTRPDGYSMRSSAEQLERLCRGLGITAPHVVGNSLGGLMALRMTADGRVSSCVAVSPAGFYPPQHLGVVGPQLLLLKVGALLPETIYRRVLRSARLRRLALGSLYRHPEVLSEQQCVDDARALRRSAGFWPHFVRAIFHRFTRHPQVPTTILWGDHDRLLLPAQAERARERFRQNQMVSVLPLEDAGHCGQVDQPDRLVEAIERMVKRTGAHDVGRLARAG